MRAVILLKDGFEDSEALTTRDVLLRSHKLDVDLVYAGEGEFAPSSHGLRIVPDCRFEKYDFSLADILILPGGKKGVDGLKEDPRVLSLILDFAKKGKSVHAICAAPSILGKLKLLEGAPYTCYPGFETESGYTGEPVTISGNRVTGKAMAYSFDFGLAILKFHFGEEVAEAVRKSSSGIQ